MGEPTKPARRRAPSNFRQMDVSRAIRAAKAAGLTVERVEVDPKTARIVVVTRNDDNTETKVNPFDNAPLPDEPTRQTRKNK